MSLRKVSNVILCHCAWGYTYSYLLSDDESIASPHSQQPRKSQAASEALKLAIDLGDLELCTRLIQDGMDLAYGFEECKGCRPLLYSLSRGNVDIARYLVAEGASTAGRTCDSSETRGFTVFHFAAGLGSAELLWSLLEKAPDEIYSNRDPIHPLHLAIMAGAEECVKLMLDHVRLGNRPFPHQILG